MSGSWKVRGGSRREEANLNFRGGQGGGEKGWRGSRIKCASKRKDPAERISQGETEKRRRGWGRSLGEEEEECGVARGRGEFEFACGGRAKFSDEFQYNGRRRGGSSAPTPAAGLPKLRLPIFASPLGCHWQCSALLLSPHLMPCALHCSTHRVCPPSPDPLLVIQRSPSAELKYGGVQV